MQQVLGGHQSLGTVHRGPHALDDAAGHLLEWLRAVDPMVRNLGIGLFVVGLLLATASPLGGLALMATGPLFIRWDKHDAIERHGRRREWELAAADLEHRHDRGELDAVAYRRRRMALAEIRPR